MLVKKYWVVAVTLGLTIAAAPAAAFEWKSGWGQGVSEYSVSDGNQNELYIACPNYDGYVTAYAVIQGVEFSSEGQGFDVIVDGERYSNPFNTECRVCADIFHGFWEELRRANRLRIAADGLEANLPVRGASEALPALDDPAFSCHTEW
ncbi:hypothetical protein [Halomonas sp. KM-1]|uniref:hypothetical protein n=1 Tax=Halomonas sp. KM-1 TaxID=590061 RepID=UPI000288AB05|nr:hypothetical protein [Halomonas sp. KM-1]